MHLASHGDKVIWGWGTGSHSEPHLYRSSHGSQKIQTQLKTSCDVGITWSKYSRHVHCSRKWRHMASGKIHSNKTRAFRACVQVLMACLCLTTNHALQPENTSVMTFIAETIALFPWQPLSTSSFWLSWISTITQRETRCRVRVSKRIKHSQPDDGMSRDIQRKSAKPWRHTLHTCLFWVSGIQLCFSSEVTEKASMTTLKPTDAQVFSKILSTSITNREGWRAHMRSRDIPWRILTARAH